jgi:mRNA interferase RelE/StbE
VASYRVFIKASAGKELAAVGPKADRQRIIARIQGLAVEPRADGAEKLAGHAGRCRIRQGNYRIVYAVDDAAREVTVYKIGDRKDAYR